MATFEWQITGMTCKPQEGPYTDVVITANWVCKGTEGQYQAGDFGTCTFNAPGNPFTPYNQLTQQQVLDWIWGAGVDKSATEADVAARIALIQNPPTISLPLPWAN